MVVLLKETKGFQWCEGGTGKYRQTTALSLTNSQMFKCQDVHNHRGFDTHSCCPRSIFILPHKFRFEDKDKNTKGNFVNIHLK